MEELFQLPQIPPIHYVHCHEIQPSSIPTPSSVVKSSHPLFLPHLQQIVCYLCHEIHTCTFLTLFHLLIKIENSKPLFLLPAFLCFYFPTSLISAVPLAYLPWLFQSGIIFILEFQLQKKGWEIELAHCIFIPAKLSFPNFQLLKKDLRNCNTSSSTARERPNHYQWSKSELHKKERQRSKTHPPADSLSGVIGKWIGPSCEAWTKKLPKKTPRFTNQERIEGLAPFFVYTSLRWKVWGFHRGSSCLLHELHIEPTMWKPITQFQKVQCPFTVTQD